MAKGGLVSYRLVINRLLMGFGMLLMVIDGWAVVVGSL